MAALSSSSLGWHSAVEPQGLRRQTPAERALGRRREESPDAGEPAATGCPPRTRGGAGRLTEPQRRFVPSKAASALGSHPVLITYHCRYHDFQTLRTWRKHGGWARPFTPRTLRSSLVSRPMGRINRAWAEDVGFIFGLSPDVGASTRVRSQSTVSADALVNPGFIEGKTPDQPEQHPPPPLHLTSEPDSGKVTCQTP